MYMFTRCQVKIIASDLTSRMVYGDKLYKDNALKGYFSKVFFYFIIN